MKRLTLLLSFFSILSLVSGATAAPAWNNTTTLLPAATIGQEPHMPLIMWLTFFGVALLCFIISLTPRKSAITELHFLYAVLSTALFFILGVTSLYVREWSYETALVQVNESSNLLIQPVVYELPGWIGLIMLLFIVLSIINVYYRALDYLQESGVKKGIR